MSDNVIVLPVVTSINIPPERVLSAAVEANLGEAVVIGWDENGDFYFASSIANGSDVLWLLKLAERALLDQ